MIMVRLGLGPEMSCMGGAGARGKDVLYIGALGTVAVCERAERTKRSRWKFNYVDKKKER